MVDESDEEFLSCRSFLDEFTVAAGGVAVHWKKAVVAAFRSRRAPVICIRLCSDEEIAIAAVKPLIASRPVSLPCSSLSLSISLSRSVPIQSLVYPSKASLLSLSTILSLYLFGLVG